MMSKLSDWQSPIKALKRCLNNDSHLLCLFFLVFGICIFKVTKLVSALQIKPVLVNKAAALTQGHSRTRELDSEELLEQLPALQRLLFRLIGCHVNYYNL